MSILTLEFQQMFYLVNRTTGAAILLPSDGHGASITGTLVDSPILLTGVDVFIRQDGVQITDLATLRPAARLLAHFDYVFHTQVRPRPELMTGPVPDSLNARFFLSGGFLTELPAASPTAAEMVWKFTQQNGEVTLTQQLTDRLMFTLPLDADSKYQVVVRSSAGEQIIDVPAEGGALVILNKDELKSGAAIEGKHTLTEFAILYNLTTAATLQITYPYPVAYSKGLGGGEQPICTGGQGDDGDDPPPP